MNENKKNYKTFKSNKKILFTEKYKRKTKEKLVRMYKLLPEYLKKNLRKNFRISFSSQF